MSNNHPGFFRPRRLRIKVFTILILISILSGLIYERLGVWTLIITLPASVIIGIGLREYVETRKEE